MPPEPAIKGNGFGELRDVRRRTAGEPSAAGDWRNLFHTWTGPNVRPANRNVTPKDAKPGR